jgi:hypothetical protein
MRTTVHIALFVGLAIAGCGDSHTPEADAPEADVPEADAPEAHPCPGLDAYFQTEWVRDGVPGESMCNTPRSFVYHPDPDSHFWEAVEISLGGVQERPGIPFCGVSASFWNMLPLVTGEVGPVTDDRDGPDEMLETAVYLEVHTAPSEERCAAGGADFATVTGGTWEVLQGGDEGERVEVVLRDVTFAPYDGLTFEYTRFRWRGILGVPRE